MAVKNMLKKRASSKRSPVAKKYKKNFEKKNDKVVHKPKQKPTTLVATDVQFARSLASNDKKKREKTLKKLRVWISVRSKTEFAFTEMDFMRLWKGLFYCMWMSDKPLIQEDLAESISQLVHSFESKEMAILYTKCALNTLSIEWFGIDQYRLDKFQMLVRRILRQTFNMCKKQSWNLEWVKSVAKVIEEILLNEKCALGFSFHITDIFCEELAKVSEGVIEETAVAEFLRPFVINLAAKSDNRQIRHTIKQVFRYLIFQSDVGMDYKEKFEAWSKAGFPTGSIDAMEKVEISDEEVEMDDEEIPEVEEKEKALDPRAGRVDVVIQQLPFNPQDIVNLLEEYKLSSYSTPRTRKHMSKLIEEFNEIGKGNMPLGIKEVNIPKRKKSLLNPTKAAKRLLEFEDELYERKKLKKAKTSGKTPVVKAKKIRVKKNKVKSPEKGPTPEVASPAKEEKEEKEEEEEVKTPVKAVKSAEVVTPVAKLAETPTPVKKQKLKSPEKAATVAEKILSPKKKKLKTPEKTSPLKKLKVKTPSKSPLVSGATPPTKKEKLATPVNTPTVLDATPGVKKNKLKSPKVKIPIVSVTTPLAKKEKSKSPEKTATASGSKTPTTKETFKTPVKTPLVMEASSSAKKKVTIALENNTAQQTSEYFRKLRMSPQLPFDATKKPPPGVLKKGFVLSPINPWYRRSLL